MDEGIKSKAELGIIDMRAVPSIVEFLQEGGTE
jgi:hypothetical protein